MTDLIREGLTGYVKGKEVPDLLGEHTKFRVLTSKIIKNIVLSGKWFSFCTRADDSQIDVLSIENDDGIKLGRILYDELESEVGYRTTLYRYLLHDYLCYLEVPTVIKRRDSSYGVQESYNKSLVTANIGVIAEWLGISYAEAFMFYGSRVDDNGFDNEEDFYPYVKLTIGKNGERKVSKPRKDIDLSIKGTRIVPVFAINYGLSILHSICSKDFYNITFIKDSGQRRTMNICFDWEKLSSIYSDKGLLASAFEEQYSGDFLESELLPRGYIRVIEVGTSLKSKPVRSINLARIVSFERAEPDLTFINIDLSTVKDKFLNSLASININYKELVDMLDVFKVGSERKYNGKVISSYNELENWVESQELTLSTPFIKQLALFMIGNPQWFGGWSGEDTIVVADSIDIENNSDGSDDDDDLDFEW